MPINLPPGNTPAWSNEDAANTIADIWQQQMWPRIWPGLTHRYENAGELNADLAGLTSFDAGVLAFTRSDSTLWVWSGTAWQIAWRGSAGTLTPRAAYDAGWRQSSDNAAITINNGTATYRWNRSGVNVFATGFIVRGSTTTFGGTNVSYVWNLPVAPRDYRAVSGTGLVVDASTGAEYPCVLRGTGGTAVSLILAGTGKRVGNTVTGSGLPVWDIGDQITWDVTYEGVA